MKEKKENQKLLSPTSDVVFQCLFGKKENKDITKDLISKVLGKEIEEISLDENPKLIPKYPDKKMRSSRYNSNRKRNRSKNRHRNANKLTRKFTKEAVILLEQYTCKPSSKRGKI